LLSLLVLIPPHSLFRSTVSTFIRAKYVDKKYLASPSPNGTSSEQHRVSRTSLPAIAESAGSIARR
jgi:hypothetical protein